MSVASKTKQEAISAQQSKTLIKNMIRVSVSSICFYRDIFPQTCFSFKPYGNMEIVQLDAAELSSHGEILVKDAKAFLLTQWLERGVFKVLDDSFLSSMTFAVYTKHPTTKTDLLLEAYEFKFTYSDGKLQINGVSLQAKEDIKCQAGKFVRNLVTFSSSLDDLPKENWITMEIKYNENVPSQYEAEFFDTSFSSGLSFPKESIRAKIGKIDTPFVCTEAKYHGLESLLHENLCQIGIIPADNSKDIPVRASSIFQASTSLSEDKVENMSKQLGELSVERMTSESYSRVKRYLLRTGLVELKGASNDLDLEEWDVREQFEKLVAEDFLAKRNNRFRLTDSAANEKSTKVIEDSQDLQCSRLAGRTKKPIIIEDIEDVYSATSKGPVIKEKIVKYSSKAALELKKKDAVQSEKVGGDSSYDKKQVEIAHLSQMSDASSFENVGKKRVYGKIKDPIHVVRNWEKKRKVDAVVTPL